MSYFKHVKQDVVVDSSNSTSTPINAGLWWAGVATTSLGIAGIQVLVNTDQNASVYVDQSSGLLAGVGTATITGTNTLNGTLTKFTRDLHIGDVIIFDPSGTPQTLTITSISSDTTAGCSTAVNEAVAKAFNQHYWDIIDVYNFYTSTKNFGVTVQAIGSYLRVRVNNTSSVNQTYLRVETALCPIVESLPRSLNNRGNLKVAIQDNIDSYGFSVENTPQGETRSITPIRQVGVAFEGPTLDANFWKTTLISGGTVTQSNGRVDMLSNTSADAIATLYSIRRARHIAGYSNVFRMAGRFGDTGTANNIRQFGAVLCSNYTLTISSATVVAGNVYSDASGVQYTILVSGTVTTTVVFATGTPTAGARTYTLVSGAGTGTLTGSAYTADSTITDGYLFQLSGTTFSVVAAIGGDISTGKVDSGAFNGNLGATYVPDVNMKTWEIYYNSTTAWFSINGVLLHTASNTQTPMTNSQSLNVVVKNASFGGGTTSAGMYLRSVTIKTLGPLETESTYKYLTTATTTILKYGGGRLKTVTVGDVNLNAGAFTIYDGLSANAPIICAINIPKQAAANPFTLTFDCPFHNGLTVVNAVATQVTVIYE